MFKSVFSDSVKHSRGVFSAIARSLVIIGALTAATVATEAQANPKYAGIVVDAKTGKVLYGEDADQLRYPASLTKMMTLYLTFEALESGKIKKTTPVPFSKNASAEPPSKLGVRAGKAITVEQAILSLVTRSANDSATALGELLGGSEARFAKLMTAKARALGMTRTTYRNANGLPNNAQVTTARDQARLGIALRQHFPQYYDYFSTRSFRFGKQTIGNHNRLLGNVRGVDGIKTGYTRASGFNLVSSAQVNGRSIVAVVLGGRSGGSRDAQMRKLIAEYLPDASRRGGGNLIAETQPAATLEVVAVSTRTTLPDNGPVPDFRYTSEGTQTAYAKTIDTSKVNPAQAALATLQGQQQALAVPQAAPDYVPENSEGDRSGVDDLTTGSTASADVPSGWVIQIGATPDHTQALALLENAKSKGGKALNSAQPFTVAFVNGNEQLYRARFGGFGDQDKAVSACKTLKKKGFACWASLQ